MTLRVSGKNLDIGESLRTYVGARIDSIVARYSDEPASGHVTLERDGAGFRTDCTLHCNSTIVQADADAQDPYASFNKAADRVEKRLEKLKHRQRDRGSSVLSFADHSGLPFSRQADVSPNNADNESANNASAEEMDALVIAEPFASLKEMSVSTAVRELDVSNAPVLVFRHAGDGHTSIVYRRPDGHIGWIDATASL
jgi:ribosomal subunit interface protein